MKRLVLVLVLGFFGFVVWRIGARLSADAVGMAVGLLFGVLAGVPAALLVLASNRQRSAAAEEPVHQAVAGGPGHAYGAIQQQPPVIVVTGAPFGGQYAQAGHDQQTPQYLPLPGPTGGEPPREFRVVGEQQGVIDEW